MPVDTVLKSGALRVFDYRCSAGPNDRPFIEQHGSFSISYVRRGSFGCVTRGRSFELVAGSFLLGRPGDEYLCTHEHHLHGDECLSFHFDAALLDALGLPAQLWRSGALPPVAELGVLGARAQAAAAGQGELARPPPRGTGGIVAGCARARAARSRAGGTSEQRERLSLPAPV